jgi:hypothetical protein
VKASTHGHEPVIVTSEPLVARLAWRSYRKQRWLLTTDDTLRRWALRLSSAGVETLTLVTTPSRRDDDLGRVGSSYRLADDVGTHERFTVLVLRAV